MADNTRYDIARFLSRQLAQATTAVATAASSIYSPGDGVEAIVKTVIICNTSGSDAAFDLYHDDNGTTYDKTTQLRFSHTVTAGKSYTITDELYVDSSGNIAAACGQASSPLTITLYGDEAQVRSR